MAIKIAGISIHLKDEAGVNEIIDAAAMKAAREVAHDIFYKRAPFKEDYPLDVDSRIEVIAEYLLDNYHQSN